jgi:hypothetical protein
VKTRAGNPSRPAPVPALYIDPGRNGRLDTLPTGNDDYATAPWGARVISHGGDRVIQTRPLLDDIIPSNENGIWTFGALPRGGTQWTAADGELRPITVDGATTDLRVKAGSPATSPGNLAVKWTMHSFRGTAVPASFADPVLHSCYTQVP